MRVWRGEGVEVKITLILFSVHHSGYILHRKSHSVHTHARTHAHTHTVTLDL